MRCPVCQAEYLPSESSAKPFCSERCRMIDLGRWLGEDYSLPRIPDPEDDETPEELFPPEDDPPRRWRDDY